MSDVSRTEALRSHESLFFQSERSAALSNDTSQTREFPNSNLRSDLIEFAEQEYRYDQARAEVFADRFPRARGYHILLKFVLQMDGEFCVTISDILDASEVSETLTLRYLANLIAAGLLFREQHAPHLNPEDRIGLSNSGKHRLHDLCHKISTKPNYPP